MEYWTNRKIERLVYQANQLKLQGHWLEAGDAFCEAAKLNSQKGSQQASELVAVRLQEAANCFKMVDKRYAILAMETTASLRAQLGQFSDAAAIHEKIADHAKALGRQYGTGGSWLMLDGGLDEARRQKLEELQLTGCLDVAAAKSGRDSGTSSMFGGLTSSIKSWLPSWNGPQLEVSKAKAVQSASTSAQAPSAMQLAVRHYQLAADCYSAESLTARECECLTKKSELLTEIDQLDSASQEFLKLTQRAMSHELLSFGAVKLAFKACLCRLQAASGHLDEAKDLERLLAQAEAACPAFSRSEEAVFVREIGAAIRARDITTLDAARRRFEKGNSVDDFCSERLGGLRKALSGEVQLT